MPEPERQLQPPHEPSGNGQRARRRAVAVNVRVTVLFVVLTIAMTWPLVLLLGSGVRDPGDPLLTSWILAWGAEQVSHGNVAHFFDANTFYPHHGTLAYSENLFPQALVVTPLWLATRNPVLLHNVVLMLAFITSGLGMFALARRLSGSTFGAIVAGIVFAFSPFMFSHLSHVQIISAGGIPLSFYFLERLFDGRRWRDALLLALVVSAQMLANGYYALFLALFLGFFVAVRLFLCGLVRTVRLWLQLAAAGALTALLAGPFFLTYLRVSKEMGFAYGIGSQARWLAFLVTPDINRLYGSFTQRWSLEELQLFPGILAVVLAGLGLWLAPRAAPSLNQKKPPLVWRLSVGRVVSAVIILVLIVMAAVLAFGRVNVSMRLATASLARPLLVLAVLLVARAWLRRREGRVASAMVGQRGEPLGVYLVIGVLALLFSFGEQGPFPLLRDWVPGFASIRAVVRFHIFAMFALALFAAFGAAAVAARLKPHLRPVAMAALPLLALAEYASFPLPLERARTGREVPEVYRWLAKAGDARDTLVELPLPAPGQSWCGVECPRVYFSAFHWKPIVNGFSGFSTPLYDELRQRWSGAPVAECLDDIEELGLRGIVVHTNEDGAPQSTALLAALRAAPHRFRLVRQFPDVEVFEVLHPGPAPVVLAQDPSVTPLPRSGWSVTASVNPTLARLAVDGDPATRWHTGPQRPGSAFTVDFGREELVAGVSMTLGFPLNFPRGYRVELARDGTHFHTATEGTLRKLPLAAFLRPADLPLTLRFAPIQARSLRIVQTGQDAFYYFSIHELDVLTPRR
jgi:hypothetical protein